MKKVSLLIAVASVVATAALWSAPAAADNGGNGYNGFTPHDHQPFFGRDESYHGNGGDGGNGGHNGGNDGNGGGDGHHCKKGWNWDKKHNHCGGGGQGVPEPATLALMTLGFGGVGFSAWKRRRSRA